jgi:hypothetical protein
VCPKCGVYQGGLPRRLGYVAAVISALTIVGGAVAYAAKTVPAVRRFVSWRTDLQVFALDSSHSVSVVNKGDGPVWLSHVSIDIHGVGISSVPINKTVDPSQVVTTSWRPQGISVPTLINHATPSEWMRAIADLKSNHRDTCVRAVVFSADDSSYQIFAASDRNDPHRTPQLTVSAKLHYSDLKTGPGEREIPVHGLLFVRDECARRLGLRSLAKVLH